MNKAKEDYPELDIDDPQTRDEFQEQYDRTMDDLSAGEICTVTNLDGDFAPTAGDTYNEPDELRHAVEPDDRWL